jgi:hypothetical protein
MGWFDVVKTVATGGLNKAIPAAKKVANTSVGKVVNKAINPVSQLKALSAAASKNKVTNVLNKAVNPVVHLQTAYKAQQTVAKKVSTAATALHLPSISAQLNVKKMVTDPKGYVSDMAQGYAKDVSFAGQVYTRFKSGDIKGLAKQAGSETVAAFGGSKALQDKVGDVAGAVGQLYAKAKGIKDTTAQPTVSQLTGDMPVPLDNRYDTTPLNYTPDPMQATTPAQRSNKKTVLLVGAAVLALVVVVWIAAR